MKTSQREAKTIQVFFVNVYIYLYQVHALRAEQVFPLYFINDFQFILFYLFQFTNDVRTRVSSQ